MLDLAAQPLVAIPAASLAHLGAVVTRDGGDPAPLQEAGHAAGDGLYEAFAAALATRGLGAPESLDVATAQVEAAAFFREAGWGEIQFASLGVVVALDSTGWKEADAAARSPHPSCYFSTGLLAGFFARLADAPLAALEVECRSTGAHRCRFLLGSADALDAAYDEMARGGDYAAAVLSE